MNSIDKTLNCILPSGMITSIFSICKHTNQESFESGHPNSNDMVTEILGGLGVSSIFL